MQAIRWGGVVLALLVVMGASAAAPRARAAPPLARWRALPPDLVAQQVQRRGHTLSADAPPAKGIRGRVTLQGLPAEGVGLSLMFQSGESSTVEQVATTTATGAYLFPAPPTLGAGQSYYVLYGPNLFNAERVSYWFAPPLTHYRSGENASGGDFDLATVRLREPERGARLALPIRFSWERRAFKSDGYRLMLSDFSTAALADPLGYAAEVTIDDLPPWFVYGGYYFWSVWIEETPESAGIAKELRPITFLAPAPTATAVSPTATPALRLVLPLVLR
jgi:hypothetical protein